MHYAKFEKKKTKGKCVQEKLQVCLACFFHYDEAKQSI